VSVESDIVNLIEARNVARTCQERDLESVYVNTQCGELTDRRLEKF
jgi:hypothetical protein